MLSGSAETGGQGKNLPHWFDPHSKVHIQIGCDSCGVNSLFFQFLHVHWCLDGIILAKTCLLHPFYLGLVAIFRGHFLYQLVICWIYCWCIWTLSQCCPSLFASVQNVQKWVKPSLCSWNHIVSTWLFDSFWCIDAPNSFTMLTLF